MKHAAVGLLGIVGLSSALQLGQSQLGHLQRHRSNLLMQEGEEDRPWRAPAWSRLLLMLLLLLLLLPRPRRMASGGAYIADPTKVQVALRDDDDNDGDDDGAGGDTAAAVVVP